MAKIGGAGGLGGLLSAGAIIQSFRAIINRAQEARDAVAEIGRSVDASTASVARLADAWDRLKAGAGDIGISVLAPLVNTGEKFGSVITDNIARLREFFGGPSLGQQYRTMKIEDEAGANAARLSSPQAMAAAKARGDGNRAAAARADEQSMREVASLMNDAAERRERTTFEALPIAQQITELERRKLNFQKEYANTSRSALARAQALNNVAKTEEEIVKKKAEQEKEVTAEKKRQESLNQQANENAKDTLETADPDRDAVHDSPKRASTRPNSGVPHSRPGNVTPTCSGHALRLSPSAYS